MTNGSQHIITLDDLKVLNCEALTADKPKGGWDIYAMEPKFDGFRIVTHYLADGSGIEMYTRSMKRNEEKLPYICEEIVRHCPPGTVLDGEIVALQRRDDGTIYNDFEHVQSIMLSKPERAVRVARETRPLDYMVFDMLFQGGRDMRGQAYTERRMGLELLLNRPHWERTFMSASHDASPQQHDEYYGLGFEGTVIKRKDSPYVNDARGKGWYKIKPQKTIDAIIMGYLDGDGKYMGQIGSIVFGQVNSGGQLIERGTCSGMTDAVRLDISRNRDVYMNTVIELAHMGTYKNSPRLRHPQFKRFRPDKRRSDVHWHDE